MNETFFSNMFISILWIYLRKLKKTIVYGGFSITKWCNFIISHKYQLTSKFEFQKNCICNHDLIKIIKQMSANIKKRINFKLHLAQICSVFDVVQPRGKLIRYRIFKHHNFQIQLKCNQCINQFSFSPALGNSNLGAFGHAFNDLKLSIE